MNKLGLLLAVVTALAAASAARSRAQEQPRPDGSAPVVTASVGTASVGTATPSGLDRLVHTNQLVGVTPGGRDPFSSSSVIRQRAAEGRPEDMRLTPGQGVAIPKLTLRGYVEPKGKPPVALVEIAGQGCYPVRAGDTIGLTASGRTLVFRILSVEAAGVRIETGTLGQVIVVR